MKKLLSLSLVCLLFVSLMGACAQQAASSTASTAPAAGTASSTAEGGWSGSFDGKVKVGAVGPLTGASAESGIAAQQGQQLAVAEWNEKGGIVLDGKHYEIELIYEDSAGAPETAVAAAEKLLGVDKVDILFADTIISSCILAVMDLAPKYPDVVFSTVEGVSTNIPEKYASDPEAYANFFKACWSSDAYGRVVANSTSYLVEKGAIPAESKTVAYVFEDTDYGRNNVTAAEAVFSEQGWKTVAYEPSAQGNTDFYSQIYKLVDLKPDIVVSCFVPQASGVAYLKQVSEIGAGWTDIGIVYPSKPNFFEDTGSAASKLFWTPIEIDYGSEKLLEFAEKIDKMFGVSVQKCQCSGYDVTNMMFEAVEKAGTWKAKEGLIEAYASSQYEGLCGTFVFDENHCAQAGEGFLNMGMGQVQDDAQTTLIVWPENMAQADPVPQR